MKEKFIKALESNDLDEMRNVPKGDLHNHITRGGNKRYIEEWAGASIPECPKLKDLNDMNRWNAQHIKPLLQGKLGYEKRIEASFVQARFDGVTVLHMSVTMGEEELYEGSVEKLVQAVKRLHKTYAPDITFVPELAFVSNAPVDEINEKIDSFPFYI